MSYWRCKPPAGTGLKRGDPLASSLILYPGLNEGSGDTWDLVGGIRGTNSGEVYVGGPRGTVLQCNATSSIDFGQPACLNFAGADFSISCWIRTTGNTLDVWQKSTNTG